MTRSPTRSCARRLSPARAAPPSGIPSRLYACASRRGWAACRRTSTGVAAIADEVRRESFLAGAGDAAGLDHAAFLLLRGGLADQVAVQRAQLDKQWDDLTAHRMVHLLRAAGD